MIAYAHCTCNLVIREFSDPCPAWSTLCSHKQYWILLLWGTQSIASALNFIILLPTTAARTMQPKHNHVMQKHFTKLLWITWMGARGDEIFCMYSYRNWIEPESPCIQLRLEATKYYYTLSLWRQYFPRKQIIVIRTEDLEADQTDVTASLYRFWGSPLGTKDVSLTLTLSSRALEKIHQLYDFFILLMWS